MKAIVAASLVLWVSALCTSVQGEHGPELISTVAMKSLLSQHAPGEPDSSSSIMLPRDTIDVEVQGEAQDVQQKTRLTLKDSPDHDRDNAVSGGRPIRLLHRLLQGYGGGYGGSGGGYGGGGGGYGGGRGGGYGGGGRGPTPVEYGGGGDYGHGGYGGGGYGGSGYGGSEGGYGYGPSRPSLIRPARPGEYTPQVIPTTPYTGSLAPSPYIVRGPGRPWGYIASRGPRYYGYGVRSVGR